MIYGSADYFICVSPLPGTTTDNMIHEYRQRKSGQKRHPRRFRTCGNPCVLRLHTQRSSPADWLQLACLVHQVPALVAVHARGREIPRPALVSMVCIAWSASKHPKTRGHPPRVCVHVGHCLRVSALAQLQSTRESGIRCGAAAPVFGELTRRRAPMVKMRCMPVRHCIPYQQHMLSERLESQGWASPASRARTGCTHTTRHLCTHIPLNPA